MIRINDFYGPVPREALSTFKPLEDLGAITIFNWAHGVRKGYVVSVVTDDGLAGEWKVTEDFMEYAIEPIKFLRFYIRRSLDKFRKERK